MTMAKKLPLLAPSIHTFEVNGTYTDCEAKRTVFMAIQKMVSAGKYYRIPYHSRTLPFSPHLATLIKERMAV